MCGDIKRGLLQFDPVKMSMLLTTIHHHLCYHPSHTTVKSSTWNSLLSWTFRIKLHLPARLTYRELTLTTPSSWCMQCTSSDGGKGVPTKMHTDNIFLDVTVTSMFGASNIRKGRVVLPLNKTLTQTYIILPSNCYSDWSMTSLTCFCRIAHTIVGTVSFMECPSNGMNLCMDNTHLKCPTFDDG